MSPRDHKALALLREDPTRFATQGTIVTTWRTYRGRQLGPYYRLAWRENGRQRSIYLGRQSPLLDEVRRLLHEAQTIRRMLREHRRRQAEFKEHVIRPLQQYVKEIVRLFGNGLYLDGWQLRGTKTAGPRLTTADVPEHLVPKFPLPLPSFLTELHSNHTNSTRERTQSTRSPLDRSADSSADHSPSSKTASENRQCCVSPQKSPAPPRTQPPDYHERRPRKNVDQKRPWLSAPQSHPSRQQHRHPEAPLKSVDQKRPRGPPVHVTSNIAPIAQ